MKTLFLWLCFFSLIDLQAQKVVKKAFIGPRTESIHIDSQYCYQVELGTAKTNEVQVTASIEGEYAKDLLVSITESGTTIVVSAGFHPNFITPNDKLSAHKVISIALLISLPEYREVHIYGTNSNVSVSGKYEKLDVKLANGRCTLDDVVENVVVNTQKGDIVLKTSHGSIAAKSTYGTVYQEPIPEGDNQYMLNTVEGNIHLTKTK